MRYAAPPVPAVSPTNSTRPIPASTGAAVSPDAPLLALAPVLSARARAAHARVAASRCIVEEIASSGRGAVGVNRKLRVSTLEVELCYHTICFYFYTHLFRFGLSLRALVLDEKAKKLFPHGEHLVVRLIE